MTKKKKGSSLCRCFYYSINVFELLFLCFWIVVFVFVLLLLLSWYSVVSMTEIVMEYFVGFICFISGLLAFLSASIFNLNESCLS